jgi:hypothetical protein
MGGDFYEYHLPSDIALDKIDDELESYLKEDGFFALGIKYGYLAMFKLMGNKIRFRNAEDKEENAEFVNNSDGKFRIFENENQAFRYVQNDYCVGHIDSDILYVTHVKNEKDPNGWV